MNCRIHGGCAILAAVMNLAYATTLVAQPCATWNAYSSEPNVMNDTVRAVAVYNGATFAAGVFSSAGTANSRYIVRWNGNVWESVANGLTGGSGAYCMQVHNGQLIVGGSFSQAGGQPAQSIAQWNGLQWQPFSQPVPLNAVLAMTVHDGNVIAAGERGAQPSYVARWDGKSWELLGSEEPGSSGAVVACTVHGGEIVTAGTFNIGGNAVSKVSRWDGSQWQPMGSGFAGEVYALASFQGQLIAGGWFSQAGGNPAFYLARWNGSAWQALPSGVNNAVFSLAVHNDELLVGGNFSSAGGIATESFASWNGTSWKVYENGLAGNVLAITGSTYDLIVGGSFEAAGQHSAMRIARWGCPVPFNNACKDALLALVGSHSFTTFGATGEGPDEPNLCGGVESAAIQNDVWYKFIAQCNGIAHASVCNADFDTKMAVYQGCPTGPDQAIACNDNGCGSGSSTSFAVSANQLYRIRIGSASGVAGSGTLVITCTPQSSCPADLNHDNTVGVPDLLGVIGAWGACAQPCPPSCAADISADCIVGVPDLLSVIGNWGACAP